jgi:hypothetical protein
MSIMHTNEEICRELLDSIPQDQLDTVLNQQYCDIDGEFLGFVKEYKHLSEIIPKHFTVIDCGCAYNPQSYFFQRHKRFIAIDNFKDTIRFQAPGTEFYHISIEAFIQERLHEFDLDETFAICSYVPDWGALNKELVRKSFKNVFVYYPHGNYTKLMGRK